MKNIQGTEENLELFNKDGVKVYAYCKYWECTYDSNGKELTFKNSGGYSWKRTYDPNGKELTYKDSDGYSYEYTYNSNGNTLTFKDSSGYSCEYTRDSNGKELTFKNSNGISRGFDIPEYTMEQLIEKVGNFKLVK